MKRCVTMILTILLSVMALPASAGDYDAMMNKAFAFIESGEYDKALAAFALLQRAQPGDSEGYVGEAWVRLQTADYAGAARAIDRALDIAPLKGDNWLWSALIDAKKGDVAAFEEDMLFAEVCGARVNDELALAAAAMYTGAGRYADAVEYFEAVDMTKMTDDDRSAYGKALARLGRRDEADLLGLVKSPDRNDALDEAFERDALYLAEAEPPEARAGDVVITDELLNAMDLSDEQAAVWREHGLSKEDITWLSFAPSGQAGLLEVNGHMMSWHEGKYRIIYPSRTRGVADEYGNLETYYKKGFIRNWLTSSVLYSPDERYAAIYAWQVTLRNFYFVQDPIVIDLTTGELVLTATYPNRFREENAGGVTAARFSSDGRYLYYMLYGNVGAYRSTLCRCDLETGETEVCCSFSDLTYYPQLAELGEDDYLILRDVRSHDEPQGLFRMMLRGGEWTAEDMSFSLKRRYFNVDNSLEYSANSGWGVIKGNSDITRTINAFMRIRPEDDFEGLNRYLVISEETDQIEEVAADELQETIDQLAELEEDKRAVQLPWHVIRATCLSPDGHYMLALTMEQAYGDATKYHLYLIRLEDLAMREVGGLKASDIRLFPFPGYMPGIEWNSDRLIINTVDGVQIFRFR